jgi:putative DNA primase/helicase
MDTFVLSHNDKHTTDLAMLAGARLVMTTEVDEKQTWAQAKINQLTGGDQITARFMRRDNFSFWPQFKLTISGNNKPRLNTVDDATRRRFNLAPFLHKPEKPDTNLTERLKEERPDILRWLIIGCLEWQKSGLNPPQVIQDATADYFDAQNYFGRWLDECCILHPTLETRPSHALKSYQDWCRQNGEEVTDNRSLRGLIEKTPGLRYVTTEGVRNVRGLGLKPPPNSNRYGDETDN